MKVLKKSLALVLVFVMAMGLSVTTMASDAVETCTVTFQFVSTNGKSTTTLASEQEVEVEEGTTVKEAITENLSAYSPVFIDVNDSEGNYSYSYLNSMTIGGTTYESAGKSTPSVEGDWTHGTYEGWDWCYYVNNTYASDYMSSHVIEDETTIKLDYAYSSFSW